MRLRLRHFALLASACLIAFTGFSQTTTVSGTVTNKATGEGVPAVSVTIKGSTSGVFTDDKGKFRLTTNQKPPFTLIISSVGYENQEVSVTSTGQELNVALVVSYNVGEDIVVSASRVAERRLDAPVTVERVNSATIRNAPAAQYYDVIANLKGVDMTTSSLNFKTISTRGFNGSGNLRFNQLVDGMDNQAPGLNFSVGSIIGLTELDVDNMELLVGASSALYGSGGMNGTLLINSKSPFKYQGLSFQIKQGVNHVDNAQRKPAPYYDWSMRWAKKIGEKFAFKVGGQLIQAQDWQATDRRNLLRNNVLSQLKGGNRDSDPNYDGVNVFGDEASASMASIAQAVVAQGTSGYIQAALGLPTPPTSAQIQAFLANPAGQAALNTFLSTNTTTRPFYLGSQAGVFGGQLVSRTGYDEKDLVDYNSYNIRLSGGAYYKITSDIEASLTANWGTGTTVYTGADRYSLKNLIMGQYKLEFKGKNWMLKGYTTQENSGDSYTATTAAVAVNSAWRTNSDWFATYTGNYSGARLAGLPDAQAHYMARAAADAGRYLPGTPQYQAAFNNAISTPISKGGAKFADKSDMNHIEGQLNLTSYLNNVVDVIVGSHFRQYVLNSQGTIFADTAGKIKINEYGAYLQAQKKLFGDLLKLTGSVRYDKNENFKGRFTPRLSAVVQVAKDNNIRLSYQTAYRFPSNQDQWINLQTPASRLIGGLPEFETFFNFKNSPAYTAESIVAYRATVAAGTPNPLVLKTAPFASLKPESVKSYELGYRGLMMNKKLLVDVYGYYSKYEDFLGRVAVGRGQSANPSLAVQAQELASPFTTTNYSFITNTSTPVKALGWGIGAEYKLFQNYNIVGNVYSDELRDVPADFVTFFNTPKYRVNLGVNNADVYKGLGFGIMYKWQDKTYWEGTFGSAEIPAYDVLDVMVSYKLPKTKSLFKIGATNLANNYYQSAFGNPSVGGLYYISFGYNVF
jgi:outer membrane receptor protein involved in Fe transport